MYKWIGERLIDALLQLHLFNWSCNDAEILSPLLEYLNSTQIGSMVFLKLQKVIGNTAQPPNTKTTTPPKEFKIKVIDEVREDLYNIIKEYFEKEQHEHLLSLFSGGKINGKLIFKGKANQLTNIFKQLFENNMIIIQDKKDLRDWIVENFANCDKNEVKELNTRTTLDSLSNKYYECKKPIIEITTGKINKK